nr:hypothetical protein [Mucilaginibacter sp. FT3.2]
MNEQMQPKKMQRAIFITKGATRIDCGWISIYSGTVICRCKPYKSKAAKLFSQSWQPRQVQISAWNWPKLYPMKVNQPREASRYPAVLFTLFFLVGIFSKDFQ